MRELEQFADVRDLRLAFDPQGKVYLIGSGFQELLQSNLALWREVRAEMRDIIARRCPRVSPDAVLSDSSPS